MMVTEYMPRGDLWSALQSEERFEQLQWYNK